MTNPKCVKIYLHRKLLERARQGKHTFLSHVKDVLEAAGHSVQFDYESHRRVEPDALSLVHMHRPLGARGLVFRRVYHYPFWQIEAVAERWNWQIAKDPFVPDPTQAEAARKFQRFWRKRLFGTPDAPHTPDGPVYVPLQGRLRMHRSFQCMSPVDMLKATLTHVTDREVIATLHPKEEYSEADHKALFRLETTYPNLRIIQAPPEQLLPHCAYVVTQNSAVAFGGYFFNKPAILFAKIDFHHIAQSLTRQSAETAFARVNEDIPDFAAYVHWFWQIRSINAGRDDAPQKIAERFRALGWPV